jgi:cell wall assembly regulator SMI1
MRNHGRPFATVLNPGATLAQITAAEAAIGFALPSSLSDFLSQWNGVFLDSRPAEVIGPKTSLIVYDLDALVKFTNEAYEFLCSEVYMGHPIPVKPANIVMPGRYRHGEIILRMDECDNEAGVEPPARIQHEPLQERWRKIADSFDDWLLKSLTSMAETSVGFNYTLADCPEPELRLW